MADASSERVASYRARACSLRKLAQQPESKSVRTALNRVATDYDSMALKLETMFPAFGCAENASRSHLLPRVR
jgi:hypothetical protein